MKLKQIRVDGYKNLIGCVVDLGDFNVLVGPNNSGKSNLLEAIQMLWPICFGDDKLRENIFQGSTPPTRWGSSICHLPAHEKKPMKIGVSFETDVDNKKWNVEYDVKIQCDQKYKSENSDAGFISESLVARTTKPSRTGPDTIYIDRKDKKMRILGNELPIEKDNSSLLAIRSIYPDFKNLPMELKNFVESIAAISNTHIFSFSPKTLRNTIGTEEPIRGLQVSALDLPFIAEGIKKEGKKYELFREAFCDILELDFVRLVIKDVDIPEGKNRTKTKTKKIRFFFVVRKGDVSFIDECSDGTITVASVLATLLSVQRNQEPMMFIEEPENYLHPAALKKLVQFVQDHSDKWPILITTHSPFLLNYVNPEDVRVAVIDQSGAAHFEPVKNTKQLRDYLKSGLMSFGDLMVSNFEDVLVSDNKSAGTKK